MILKKILEPYLAKILFRQVIASPSVFIKIILEQTGLTP
jgi:hypothetical protein